MSKEVEHSLRLTFSFERRQVRRPQNVTSQVLDEMNDDTSECKNSDNSSSQNESRRKRKRSDNYASGNDSYILGTKINYHIDMSKDYMQKERVIDIYVDAVGTTPSVKEARPRDREDAHMTAEEF